MMMQATDGPHGDDAYDAWPHNGVCVAGFEASFQSAIIAPMQVVDNGTRTHGGNGTESPASGGAMPMFSAKVSVNMVLIAISLIGLWLWLWLWRRFVPPIADRNLEPPLCGPGRGHPEQEERHERGGRHHQDVVAKTQ